MKRLWSKLNQLWDSNMSFEVGYRGIWVACRQDLVDWDFEGEREREKKQCYWDEGSKVVSIARNPSFL